MLDPYPLGCFWLRLIPCFISSFLFLTGCGNVKPEKPAANKQIFIPARDQNHTPLYRAKIPEDWHFRLPPKNQSLDDTTKANAEIEISFGLSSILITIHTFPFSTSQNRILPLAQVERWKRQLSSSSLDYEMTKAHHSGFSGLFLENTGWQNGKETAFLAWSMQLGSLYVQLLEEGSLLLADYTIKASGSPQDIKAAKEAIIQFFYTFEPCQELSEPFR